MPEKEYVIFCDESDRRGKFYSNFYGGVRVPASFLDATNATLAAKKRQLGLTSEIKSISAWWNATSNSSTHSSTRLQPDGSSCG